MSDERRTPSAGAKRPASTFRRRYSRRKGCRFCGDKDIKIDYKEIRTLRYFISERGKIVPRRISGNCAEHQRKVCEAIKRARNISLLPFSASHSLD